MVSHAAIYRRRKMFSLNVDSAPFNTFTSICILRCKISKYGTHLVTAAAIRRTSLVHTFPIQLPLAVRFLPRRRFEIDVLVFSLPFRIGRPDSSLVFVLIPQIDHVASSVSHSLCITSHGLVYGFGLAHSGIEFRAHLFNNAIQQLAMVKFILRLFVFVCHPQAS